MIEVITQGMRDNVVAVAAHGKITHDDYTRLIIPLVEEKVRQYGKIRCLSHIPDDYDGVSPEAMWDDLKLGVKTLSAMEKVAVVSDTGWVRQMSRLFSVLVPCPVKIYHNRELPEAAAWVNE